MCAQQAARSSVAQDLLRRMANDAAQFAQQSSGAKVPRMRELGDAAIDALVRGRASPALVLSRLLALEQRLAQLQLADARRVESIVELVVSRANRVPSAQQVALETDRVKIESATMFVLQRVARQRAELDAACITAALLSTRGAQDLLDINPYVDRGDALLDAMAAALLFATRMAHANRVIGRLRALSVVSQCAKKHMFIRSFFFARVMNCVLMCLSCWLNVPLRQLPLLRRRCAPTH